MQLQIPSLELSDASEKQIAIPNGAHAEHWVVGVPLHVQSARV